jgi:hypothetical protein
MNEVLVREARRGVALPVAAPHVPDAGMPGAAVPLVPVGAPVVVVPSDGVGANDSGSPFGEVTLVRR